MRAPNAKRQAAARALVSTNRVLTVLILGARRLLSKQLDEQSTEPRHRGRIVCSIATRQIRGLLNEAEDGKDD